jgi:hypothetical protein
MATWQFSMHLVPRAGLLTVSPDLLAAFRDDEFDSLGWTTTQPVADLAERLTRVLIEERSWASSARQWGAADCTTVEVWYTDDRVDDIHARIDLREEVNTDLLALLASLAADSDGWWVGGDARGCVPIGQTEQELRKAIEGSDANRFVTDPRAFLDALRAKQDQAAR